MPGEFRNVVLEEAGDKLDSSVKNGEVLHRIKEERNSLYIIKKKEGYLDWSDLE